MEDSIFTKIIRGEIPCHKIYEDDYTFAFLDIHPQVEAHTLLVPKEQVDHLWDLDQAIYDKVWEAAKKISMHYRGISSKERVGAVVAGYGVPHAHIHIMPFAHEGELKAPQNMGAPVDHDALAQIAEKYRLA